MAERRIDAEALIELARVTLESEIKPALPPETSYALAMLTNALAIAQRAVAGEADGASFGMLDDLYDDGEGTLKQLAADIRSGEIDDDSNAALRRQLRALVIEELKVSNPRFLRERGIR